MHYNTPYMFCMELTQIWTNAHGETKDFNQSKIGTYGDKNSYFRPYIIRRHLRYVRHSKYYIGAFLNHKNYKQL